jgi:hypothetical protein
LNIGAKNPQHPGKLSSSPADQVPTEQASDKKMQK